MEKENKAVAKIPPVRSPLEQVTDALEKVSNEKRAVERELANFRSASEQQSVRMAELEDNGQNLRDELKRREADVVHTMAEYGALVERENLLSRRLTEKELELQRERAELHAQFAAREAALREQIESQQTALKEREATFRIQSTELFSRTAMLESEHASLKHELKQRAVDHERAITDLQRQKEQFQADFQSRIESKATEYVDTALASLRASEERFDRIGSKWSIGGLLAVLGGLILAYFLATEATNKIVSNKDISWALILFFGAKGAILLGLVVALVRLCLRLARNYLHESLKNAERRHAINYGKFYLSVYGALVPMARS